MPLAGKQWLVRDVAELCHRHGWTDAENLTKMVATLGAESAYYEEAFNPENRDGSTDWGMFELNDGNKGGNTKTPAQVAAFKAMAFDPEQAAAYARKMYEARGFQPWAAYTSGAYEKFLPRAVLGVANFLAIKFGFGKTQTYGFYK